MSAEDIAARFGVMAAVVRQRLNLRAVSSKLRALYRKGEINLDQLSAFAITEDHERQERVWRDYRPSTAATRRLCLRTISSLHVSASGEANEWRHASPIDFAESVAVSFDSERSRLRHGSDIGLKPVPLSYSFNR
jgi:hypothetical protein